MQRLRIAAETENRAERFQIATGVARFYGDMGLPKQAIRVLEQILEADPEDFDAHLWLWYYTRQTGDTARAVSHLNQLTAIDQEAPILGSLRSIQQTELMLTKARTDLEKVSLRRDLARAYTQLELFEDAIDQLEYARRDDPESIETWTMMRDLFAQKGANVAARHAEETIRRLSPNRASGSN